MVSGGTVLALVALGSGSCGPWAPEPQPHSPQDAALKFLNQILEDKVLREIRDLLQGLLQFLGSSWLQRDHSDFQGSWRAMHVPCPESGIALCSSTSTSGL